MNLQRFIEHVIAFDGGSYNPNYGTFNPATGYMVAIPQHEIIVEDIEDAIDAIKRLAGEEILWDDPNSYIGVWLGDGKYYIDISTNVTDLVKAIGLGQQHSQIAIWDCERSEEVRL